MMTEEQFRAQIEERAMGTQSDIAGMDLVEDVDTSYEVYVVEISGPHGKAWAGWVYMGDLGNWVYMEDGHGGVEMVHDGAIEAAVRAQTPYRDGWV